MDIDKKTVSILLLSEGFLSYSQTKWGVMMSVKYFLEEQVEKLHCNDNILIQAGNENPRL
jgi:hypothetical protein